jgi:AraC family transcriptional regulator of adaptative response / DNA-3-methyladenine glycosylase II
MLSLDHATCRAARLSRDPRFDGEFFLAVTSTGIYCRPVCPARAPRESNVRYYRTAAEASEKGFRPCLRCRPESAPSSPAWRGTATTVARAMQLIHAGALNEGSLAQLAERLGVGERYLRKLFEQQVGVSPGSVAQNQRLHFAKQLLRETHLDMSQVAFAAGFSSVRRFNSAIRDKMACTPAQLRGKKAPGGSGKMVLELHYREPYDWDGVLNFFGRHAIAGIEEVTDGVYTRSFPCGQTAGQLRVRRHPRRAAALLELELADTRQLMNVVGRVRRMFDLDANPGDIATALGRDGLLRPLLKRFPGIRSPSHWSVYEASVRAVVGQQVSLGAARNVCSRIVTSCDNRKGDTLVFPQPQQIAQLRDECLPMPNSRKQTLRSVAAHFQTLALEPGSEIIEDLAPLRGVGLWTLSLLSMRGCGDTDVFPASDLGLVKAAAPLGLESSRALTEHSAQWRPWRSYAANLLWRSLLA